MSSPDPAFPSLHVRPPTGWVNDPNGVAHVDGTYHVFFQHNPDDPLHHAIRWGHASSTDLLRWRDEPIALVPRPGERDRSGCWTGTVVDDAGVPTAVYSAVADDSGRAEVLLARSDRTLRTWVQGREPVAGMPDDPAVSDVRDPFVFAHEGRRYAIQGAGRRDGRPQVLLYACDDLERWSELGPLLTGDDPVAAELAPAHVWECPNLALVDGRRVLVLSLWRWVDGAHQLSGVTGLVGDLVREGERLRFAPSSGGPVDGGPAFYAPQLLVQPHRTLAWAWAEEHGRSEEEVRRAGWAGVLTFPRELAVVDGLVASRPAAELTGLRRERLHWRPGCGVRAAAFEVEALGGLRLGLADGGQERPVLAVPDVGGTARVLVDGSLVEAFAGPTPVTTRAYPSATSAWTLTADRPDDVTVWRLGTD